jgi:hypothetical protein
LLGENSPCASYSWCVPFLPSRRHGRWGLVGAAVPPPLDLCLVRGICGSLTRPKWGWGAQIALATWAVRSGADADISKIASSEEFVGEGERQRCLSLRNFRNFLQVESNDLC